MQAREIPPRHAHRFAYLLLTVAVAVPLGCTSSPEPLRSASAVSAADDAKVEPASGAAQAHLAQLLTAPLPAGAEPAAAAGAPVTPPPDDRPYGPPYVTGPRPGSPVVTRPSALGPGDATVYAVGDSVLLGTRDYLGGGLGSGWDLRLDGRVGRRFREGIDIYRENRASIGQVAVVLLGTNDGDGRRAPGYLDELMSELRGVQRVVVVTVPEWSTAQPDFNRAIRTLPSAYRNVVVADWQAVIAANPQFVVSDRVHLTRSGAIALSNLIAVMIGPAPARNGVVPPPPRILPIPDDPDSVAVPLGNPGGGVPTLPPLPTLPPTTSTSSTVPGASTTTSSSSSTTSSTVESTTSSASSTTAPP